MTSEANLRPTTHDDYTVGWICVLPTEETAAIAMLDHRHADLQTPPNDPNSYILGSMNGHNIVLARLPDGKRGIVAAATSAAWMLISFPSIKVGLSVGIGSGVPPRVRLGDIVVSTPAGQFPGVVQWDYGKAKEGGNFERHGSLNKPPKQLLMALQRLRTEHDLYESKIPEYLNQVTERSPYLALKYLRSDRHEDLLFRSDYPHVSKNTNYDDISGFNDDVKEEDCEFCDRNQIVKRKRRAMRVHYGLIASGDQVIKDAALRDKLNKDLNDKVLCIEMEAAGLMDDFPCIVIRGICDYADSHQNTTWQEHSAAIAAAFAKEFLSYVPIYEAKIERPAKDILEKVHGTISSIRENTAHTRAKLEGIENINILDWVTPADYGLQQSDYFQRWQPGTGQWFLDSKKFQSWLATGNQTLFCPGRPGAGKTILTSIVVNYLTSEFRHEDAGIAYIYCNFYRHNEQNISDLLASILKQLVETQPVLPENVKNLYKRHQSKRTRPPVDELYQTLQSTIASYPRVFIIVDALDECQTSNNTHEKFLSYLFNIQAESGINILVTSRFIPSLTQSFEKSTMIEVFAHNDDVRNYLDSQISQSNSEALDVCREDIKTKITEAANGMFLLARLYFEVVKDKRTRKKIKDALAHLVIGSSAYDYVYEEAMKRIMSQNPDTTELARLVLSWIVCAKRPMKALELQHALAIEPKNYQIDEDNLLPIGDMVSTCGGLVTIEEGSGIIRLIHNTTHEYLERTRSHWFPKAENTITTICATYLLLDNFEAGPCETASDLEERLRVFQFYEYAAHNWGNHARACSRLNEEVMCFLDCNVKVEASTQVLMVGNRPWEDAQDYPKRMTGLHLAAYFGVDEAVSNLIRNERRLDLADSFGRTPLSYAAENGHEAFVKLLLATDEVGINLPDKYDRTPLSYAVENGHEVIVKLCLDRGANIKTKNRNGRTLLSWAGENKHKAIARLLLDADQGDALGASLADTSQFDSEGSDSGADNGSIFSVASTFLSTTTMGFETEKMRTLFIQEFVILLNEDKILRSLTLEAISKQVIGPGRARNNFRKLLKHFASDLRVEAVNNHHRQLVGFLKTNLSNISQELFSEFSSNAQETGDMIPESRVQHYATEEKKKRVEEYLQIPHDLESDERSTPAHLNNLILHSDTNDQIEISESDGDSDHDGVDEEPGPDELPNDLLKHLDELRHFILESTAYQTLRRRFDEFVRPSLRSRLGDLLMKWLRHDHRHHSLVVRYQLSNLVAELQYIHPQEIRLDEDNKDNQWQLFGGYCQKMIEHWTQEPWDWWPLPPYLRPLEQYESRIRWQCICGEERWAEVPQAFARRLMSITRDLSKDGISMTGIQSPSASHLRDTGAHGSSENTVSPTMPSKSGEAHQPLQRAFPINVPLGGLVETQTGTISTVTLNHWVLFAVNRGTEYKLAQIYVSKLSCQRFFHELRGKYFSLRGYLRAYLSVWRYHHCDFYDFEKFADHVFAPINKDAFPELGNPDYDYQPKPMNFKPPVSTHEFTHHFYARRKRNANILVQPHSELLARLPKKLTELEEGGDKREIFWGIYAREIISLRWVLFYNFLCLLPMMGFFIIWISPLGHGTDLQNPSIPISMMISMLSLFWSIFLSSLPFGRAH